MNDTRPPSPDEFGRMVDKISGKPSKRALLSLSTLDPDKAILELIDNSIDAARVNDLSSTTVTINLKPSEGRLEIKDESGGIPRDELEAWVRLGTSRQREGRGYRIPDSIGWAGVGAIEASLSLGGRVLVASQATDTDQAYAYEINEDYLESEDWTLELFEFEPDDTSTINAGETLVRIESLNVDESHLSGSADSLEKHLATIYELYLDDSPVWAENAPSLDLTIKYYGPEEEPKEGEVADGISTDVGFDWSFLPLDGAHPRMYYGSVVEKGIEGRIRVDIVCGVTRTKAGDDAGVHLYGNGRKIFDGATGSEAGFGRQNGLNKFRSERYGRLVLIVVMRSLDYPSDLPTENNKTTLQDGHPVTEKIKDRLGRAGLMYMFFSDLNRVPTPITEPYTHTHRYAGNHGEIEKHEYNSLSIALRDHPGGDRDGRYYEVAELDHLKQTTRQHAKLGISCPQILPRPHRAAYYGLKHEDLEGNLTEIYPETDGFIQDRFEYYFGDDSYIEEPIPVEQEDLPPEDLEVDDRLDALKALARRHAAQETRFSGIKPWEEPYYLDRLADFSGKDPEKFSTIDELSEKERQLYVKGPVDDRDEEPEEYDDPAGTTLDRFVESHIDQLERIPVEADTPQEKIRRVIQNYESIVTNEQLKAIPGDTPQEKVENAIREFAKERAESE